MKNTQKLSLDALKERAEAVTSEELLTEISGGTNNACHDGGGSGGSYRDFERNLQWLEDQGWIGR